MDACPGLRICLSDGGGYAGYGAGRMDRGWEHVPETRRLAANLPSQYLNRFYYDCIVYAEQSLRFLIDSVGIDRVVFGTDWPSTWRRTGPSPGSSPWRPLPQTRRTPSCGKTSKTCGRVIITASPLLGRSQWHLSVMTSCMHTALLL